MAKLTATGESRVISEGFIALGHRDQEEGRRGLYEIGRYTTEEEAREAAKGEGVFGTPGEVESFETVLYSGGAIVEETFRLKWSLHP